MKLGPMRYGYATCAEAGPRSPCPAYRRFEVGTVPYLTVPATGNTLILAEEADMFVQSRPLASCAARELFGCFDSRRMRRFTRPFDAFL